MSAADDFKLVRLRLTGGRAHATNEALALDRIEALQGELVAALKAILPWHDPHPIEQTDNAVINQCRAALAKARGDRP